MTLTDRINRTRRTNPRERKARDWRHNDRPYRPWAAIEPERRIAPWVDRAMAGTLPAKELRP